MKSRRGTNPSAHRTRPWIPRKWAEARQRSTMESPSMLVFRTWEAWAWRARTFSYRAPSMSTKMLGVKSLVVGPS